MPFSKIDGIALITGAGSGIGEETGYAFAQAGALGIVFADLNYPSALEKAKKSNSHATNSKYRPVAIQVDVSEPESVQKMVDFVGKEFGRIDYCVNSAGISATSLASTHAIELDNFDKILKVNTRGVMLCIRAVSKVMIQQEPRVHKGRHGHERNLGRGCIVNLGSLNSYVASKGMMAYVASKHAVLGITKVAAMDLAKYGIRVNAVLPSWVATPMLDLGLNKWPRLKDVVKEGTTMGRAALPEEVADVAVILCSPSASYISGTGVVIDGGSSVGVSARL